jgi:hypothetical protein
MLLIKHILIAGKIGTFPAPAEPFFPTASILKTTFRRQSFSAMIIGFAITAAIRTA